MMSFPSLTFTVLLPVVAFVVTFVDATTPTVIQSISNDLEFDEHDRLSKHAFIYDASSPACQSMVPKHIQRRFKHNPGEESRFDVVGVEGDAYDKVLGQYLKSQPPTTEGNNDERCLAACIERGTYKDLATAVMPERIYDSSSQSQYKSMEKWFSDRCSNVEVCVMNYHHKDSPLIAYWKKPFTGELHKQLEVGFGERNTRCFHSFIGHEFVFMDESDPNNHVVVGELSIEFMTVKAFGDSPPSDQRAPSHNFDREIENTLKYEWTRHNRIKRTFSPLGFKKGRLPDDVFATTSAFYYNNAMNVVREEWKSKGVFVNWWETDVLFLQLPWRFKETLQARLRDMVQEWAGVPVEQTVMYGLRQYTQGARLLTHVDRHQTHAVSLIVNIAQGNLTEPWPVEVQDHADRIHEVTMAPGDVVYYESAKCLHGRNRILTGPNAYYVNLFTHYKPIQDGEWWVEDNPEGTPEPVLGGKPVKEECRIGGSNATSADSGVGSVECDNPALGQYVSPELFQATKPDDLIAWWRLTGPKDDEDAEEADSSENSGREGGLNTPVGGGGGEGEL